MAGYAEREMGMPLLSSGNLSELQPFSPKFVTSTPLLYYVLKEAEVVTGGEYLGPVGGRLVAEVFVGLLKLDPQSYLNEQPKWRPTLKTSGDPAGFCMIDFLKFAGVDPANRAH